MSEELESCPVCGALPIDQVDSGAVRELVRNRYKFSHQALLDDCASREAAKRIVDWDEGGRLADDEWLVERNDTAIIAICRAYLSYRQSILEEAAKVAEAYAQEQWTERDLTSADAGFKVARAIRSLTQAGKAPAKEGEAG